jgi:hypothetical protein
VITYRCLQSAVQTRCLLWDIHIKRCVFTSLFALLRLNWTRLSIALFSFFFVSRRALSADVCVSYWVCVAFTPLICVSARERLCIAWLLCSAGSCCTVTRCGWDGSLGRFHPTVHPGARRVLFYVSLRICFVVYLYSFLSRVARQFLVQAANRLSGCFNPFGRCLVLLLLFLLHFVG